MAPNTWYHFALVRSGNLVKFYINGVSRSFTNDSNGTSYTNGFTGNFNHGGDVNGKSNFFVNNSLFNESFFEGLITNVRLVKGLAVYTSNFSVATVPLTNVGDTKILLRAASSATYLNDSSSYNRSLAASGNVSFSSLKPFVY
jgi:hypothetical protein